MTRTAMIMAGGRGERMVRSGMSTPKPLVTVGGIPLVERNLCQLIAAGFEQVIVAVGAHDDQVRDFVAIRLVARGAASGVVVDEIVESAPLGNIGPAGLVAGAVDPLLVVYADNLTGIDLRQIRDDHVASAADLTLAAHRQPFAMPFGELSVDETDPTRLVAYTEKPTYDILVASAVIVLGARALHRLPRDRPTGISELAQGLVDDGASVRTWLHHAPWIDVNDARARAQAEALVARHPDLFETPVGARP